MNPALQIFLNLLAWAGGIFAIGLVVLGLAAIVVYALGGKKA